MPFCRKCGRRLVQYSKSCPDCGTSTTAPLINLKKTSVSHKFKASEKGKVIRAVLPPASPVTIKVKTAPKVAALPNPDITAEIVIPPEANAVAQAKRASKRISGAYVPVKIFAPPKEQAPVKSVFSAKHKLKNKPKAAGHARSVVQLIKLNVPRKPVAVRSKPTSPTKPVKQTQPTVTPKPLKPPKQVAPPKPITPAPVYPPHEIIKSKVSIKEDIITNPHDYETQSFEFDLTCPNSHFWPEGAELPISKGKAYCPQCGEQLRKPKPKPRRRRYHRY